MRPFLAIVRFLRSLKGKYITNSVQPPDFSETREKNLPEVVIQKPSNPAFIPTQNLSASLQEDNLASAPV